MDCGEDGGDRILSRLSSSVDCGTFNLPETNGATNTFVGGSSFGQPKVGFLCHCQSCRLCVSLLAKAFVAYQQCALKRHPLASIVQHEPKGGPTLLSA